VKQFIAGLSIVLSNRKIQKRTLLNTGVSGFPGRACTRIAFDVVGIVSTPVLPSAKSAMKLPPLLPFLSVSFSLCGIAVEEG
jgi:hypothetical protein